MKKLFVLMISALLLASCGSGDTKTKAKADDSASEISMENLVEISIPVGGMTCEGCENAVKKSIGSLEGIAEVNASHVDSVAVVKYDGTLATKEDIEAKIKEAGYEVL